MRRIGSKSKTKTMASVRKRNADNKSRFGSGSTGRLRPYVHHVRAAATSNAGINTQGERPNVRLMQASSVQEWASHGDQAAHSFLIIRTTFLRF